MPDLELKPSEVRRSEKAPLVAVVWWLACCGFLLWLTLAASNYNWKLGLGFAFPALFLGYLFGTRFRIITSK